MFYKQIVYKLEVSKQELLDLTLKTSHLTYNQVLKFKITIKTYNYMEILNDL